MHINLQQSLYLEYKYAKIAFYIFKYQQWAEILQAWRMSQYGTMKIKGTFIGVKNLLNGRR